MQKSTGMRMLMGATVLLTGGILVFSAGRASGSPTAVAIPKGEAAVNRTPAGAEFPTCWSTIFSKLPDLAVGKDVEITITVGAPLFDMKEVELIPMAGSDLKLVSGEAWKGELKKGTSHAVKFTVKPAKNGFNGNYGVRVKAPAFYDEVAAYVLAQKEGPYGTAAAQASILDQIEGMRTEQPVYEEWFGSSIEIKAAGGN